MLKKIPKNHTMENFSILRCLIHLLHAPPPSAACYYVITIRENIWLGLRHIQLIANAWNAFSEVWGAVQAVHKLTYPTKYLRRLQQSSSQS